MTGWTATPYLSVTDGAAALAFSGAAFGAEVVERYEDGDRLAHATLELGGTRIFVSEEYPDLGAVSPGTLGGSTAAVVLDVGRLTAVDEVFDQAVQAGAQVDRPPSNDPSGRSGWLLDPAGHRWNIRASR